MSQYLILAESIIFKHDKLTCINIYDNFKTLAMPSEFNFDLAVICGPHWSVGEHKLTIKAKASNGKEIDLGTATVNIPNDNFVYNAFLNNIKITMDYSVKDITFYVYSDDEIVLLRTYPVISMLVPKTQEQPQVTETSEVKEKSKKKSSKTENKEEEKAEK